MKKRLLSILLCIVVIICMMPTTALAELNTGHAVKVRFTVLYVSDEFKIGYNYGSSENTTFVCQYSTPHSDTAYSNHTISIGDIKDAADRASINYGYKITGWTKEAKRNPTVFGFNIIEPTACNKGTTIYLVAERTAPAITSYTVTYKDGCNGEVFADDVHSNLAKDAKTPEFRGTANREGYIFKGWEPDVADTVTRNATYVAQWEKEAPAIVTPDKPTGEDLNGILGDKIVTVKCINANAAHNPKMLTYGLIDNGYTIGDVQKAADNSYVCDVMFSASAYQAKYNDDTNSKHSLDPETQAQNDAFVRLTWNQALNKWTAQNDSNVVFTVACEEQHIEELYTVTYTDGVDNEEVFADQVFRNIKKGEKTPEFNGTPSRTGYKFAGWTPKKADTVTENIVYSATWSKKGTGGGGTVTYYTVKWNNYDNTTLETDYCYYGQLPKYDGTTPVKPADEKYTYEFTGWDKEIVKVTGNAVYTAQFKAIEKENPADPTNPDPTKPDPAEPTRPEQPDPTKPAKPCRPDTEVPKTGDTAADTVLVNTFVLILSALGGTALWHRRKEKNQISQ